jgi:hypothetical protein
MEMFRIRFGNEYSEASGSWTAFYDSECFVGGTSRYFTFLCVTISRLSEFEEVLRRTDAWSSSRICVTSDEAPSGRGGDIGMFFWRTTEAWNPIVEVKFFRDQMKCIGILQNCNGLKEVVDFGFAKPYLMSLDGSCVELKYNHKQQQWIIVASPSINPMYFGKMGEDAYRRNFTIFGVRNSYDFQINSCGFEICWMNQPNCIDRKFGLNMPQLRSRWLKKAMCIEILGTVSKTERVCLDWLSTGKWSLGSGSKHCSIDGCHSLIC